MLRIVMGVFGVAINAVLLPVGQYFWKLSLENGYSIKVFWSKHFIYGALCYVLGTIFWLFALSVFPLSKIYPFVSLSYIIGAMIGYLVLKEPLGWINIGGYVLLIVSLILITIGSSGN